MNYAKYRTTKHWKTMRRVALEIAGHVCAICGRAEGLEVHHKTYERIGYERLADLVVLCNECHDKYHEKLPSNSTTTNSEEGQYVRSVPDIFERRLICTLLKMSSIDQDSPFPEIVETTPRELFCDEIYRRMYDVLYSYNVYGDTWSDIGDEEAKNMLTELQEQINGRTEYPIRVIYDEYLGCICKLQCSNWDIVAQKAKLLRNTDDTCIAAISLMELRRIEKNTGHQDPAGQAWYVWNRIERGNHWFQGKLYGFCRTGGLK